MVAFCTWGCITGFTASSFRTGGSERYHLKFQLFVCITFSTIIDLTAPSSTRTRTFKPSGKFCIFPGKISILKIVVTLLQVGLLQEPLEESLSWDPRGPMGGQTPTCLR